jgi:hypothetical protein
MGINGYVVIVSDQWRHVRIGFGADSLKADWILLEGQNCFFFERDMGQTNEQQHNFNEWPISELHGEVNSIQASLKLLFTLWPLAIVECCLCLLEQRRYL